MSTSDVQLRIGALIEREAQETARLLEVLAREHDALAALDPAALEAVVEEKRAILERLESLARERGERLQTAGFSPGLDGARACLAAGPESVNATLERLVTQIRECARYNRRNGEIVLQSRQRVQAALTVLGGQPPQVETGYGPPGRHHEPPSRLLASA